MSLSAWEQDALNSIKVGLADSDPALAARLAMFTRLASAEDMPVREKIQAVKLGVARRRRRLYQRLGVGRAMMLLWLFTTLTLVTAAGASSRGASGPGACAGSWGSLCGHAAGAPQASEPIP